MRIVVIYGIMVEPDDEDRIIAYSVRFFVFVFVVSLSLVRSEQHC